MTIRLLVVTVLIAGPWFPAVGQDPTSAQQRVVEAAALLEVGQHIRIETSSRPLLEGVLVSRSLSEMELMAGGQATQVPLQDVERLWVRGRAAKSGALVGTLAGFAIGVAAGVFVAEVICDDPDCQSDDAGVIATFTLLGVGAGAGSGVLIGLAIPRWHQRYS